MEIVSKLPNAGVTIFTVMSALANEHGAINLSQGFPNYDPPARLLDLAYAHMREGRNQYAPMAGWPLLRQRIAEKVLDCYGRLLDPETEITVTAGATQALFTAIAALVRPGDEVIQLEPAYDSYRPAVEVNGGRVVPYELAAPDFRPDWAAIGRLITPRTRLIIVNTPLNPAGATFTPYDWDQLARLVEDTNIFILSDEVYEHLVYDGKPHAGMPARPDLYERSLAVYSFGKTFHNTGWKIGYCVAPPELTREFRKVHQFNVFSVNTPAQCALADFLEDPAVYRGLPAFYEAKRNFLREALQGSSLRPLPCTGTYFQAFDYRDVSDLPDQAFCQWLTREVGVAAIPFSAFYSSGRDERLIRLCFAKTEETLAAAAERLRRL